MKANHFREKKKSIGIPANGFTRVLSGLLDGSVFSGGANPSSMRFILFLSAMALFLIFNTYYAERKVREAEQLRHEMTELRIRYIQTRSAYMSLTRQSEMARRLKAEGFVEPVEPPRQIIPDKRRTFRDRLLGWIR